MDLHRLLREAVAELDREAVAELDREIVDRAQRFLRELDPESQEGLWFDAVAERYPSRLEAAVAYVREVKLDARRP